MADAEFLLDHGRYANAYYLAGYAVELGLKAIIARQFLPEVIPNLKQVRDTYTHDLDSLAKIAGLSLDLKAPRAAEQFAANWLVSSQWSEASRYEMIDPAKAHEMLKAVSDPTTGVFQWLRARW